tara:strand:- start:2579 stop:2740 length:162 start_codon:yes stop_codon:yes gene_type:complete
MNSLKSKLPVIDIKKNDYVVKKKDKTIEKKKEKYLDNLISKDFLKKYFKKEKN